ncbi:hypothetical protein [Achromobacter insolitus]|uniref:Uncharacterized protein n=1 Tax=Achromobacter insolitus TaxID=217204 RepID=A0A6S7F3V5_9BURK|nr:hypothetical protein [Achromobacter insolitus]CAB3931578.1 hypothetical protein LMG6000_02224 [Achromobacter insolitus]CAB3939449.1 hypothetical protein LMG5997_04041 [Achromobacter insolitus]
MTTKHTPGPWGHRNGRIFSVDREELTIANVARAADGDYSPANGLVLAAAPELLAALEQMLDAFVDDPLTHQYTSGRAADAARAAIAKAKGEQQ